MLGLGLALILAFKSSLGVKGLYVGYGIGVMLLALVNFYFIIVANMDSIEI